MSDRIHRIYEPILERFRRPRMKLFAERFAIDENTRVLDLGGGPFVWTLLESRPKLTILNLREQGSRVAWADQIVADGCDTRLRNKSFDVVFSNSVIEHVGGIEKQRQFAGECRRLGMGFFVQTPNKWFPFDTHTLTPFLHWLPPRLFRKLMRFSVRFLISRPSASDIEDFANLRLLTRRQLAELFPEAEIVEEKFCGITKSLIAVSVPLSPGRRSATTLPPTARGSGA